MFKFFKWNSVFFLQCGGRWCWLWGRRVSGKRVLSWASDAQLHHQHWALWGTITLYTRGPTAATSLQTPALTIYSSQTSWGRGHQTLTFTLRELWALYRSPGQTGSCLPLFWRLYCSINAIRCWFMTWSVG